MYNIQANVEVLDSTDSFNAYAYVTRHHVDIFKLLQIVFVIILMSLMCHTFICFELKSVLKL